MRLRYGTGFRTYLQTHNTFDQSAMTAEGGGPLGRLWTDLHPPRRTRREATRARSLSHPRNVAMTAPPEERLTVRATAR